MVRGALSLCTAAIDGGLPGSNVESYNCVAPAVPPKHPSVRSMAPARTLVPPPLTIQAEGLVLQRSNNIAGYKHVGKDKNRPRPFEVKMWHKGKQVRLVRSPKTCGLRGSSPQSCSPYCFPHRSSVGPA